jgi:hypothetical protein
MGFKFGGDGQELRAFAHVVGVKLNVAKHRITSAPVGFFKVWHYLIRSSLQGSGNSSSIDTSTTPLPTFIGRVARGIIYGTPFDEASLCGIST